MPVPAAGLVDGCSFDGAALLVLPLVRVAAMTAVEDIVVPLLPAFGYACDVGASDGSYLSNSLVLEDKGWLVLCVEANPFLESDGRARRKLWRQVAVGAEDRDAVDFTMCGVYPFPSNSGVVERYPTTAEKATVQVPMRRLDRLLEEAGFPRLDYLCIDVEGYEPEVLTGFAVERWKPEIIVVEDGMHRGPTPPDGYAEIAAPPAGHEVWDRIYQRQHA